MLHKETVENTTLELLKGLQSKPYLQEFCLVGGTALALKLGHRKSVDLDLFTAHSFNVMQMLENLSADFDFQLFYSANNTIKGSIDNVKVDILAHRYPLVKEPLIEEGITMLDLQDIIAMKLNAISGSGQRVKDFIDIFYLLRLFNLEQMIGFYKKKYQQYSEAVVLKSLVYFDDIDFSEWPVLLSEPNLKWEVIKKKLENTVNNYMKQNG
ncbi:MAG: hypothetical protein IEMM0006_2186 [bacterium]|nr:MAG: hypothetical protein IEMM0006_2186 [bacterium]